VRCIKNDIGSFCCTEELLPVLEKLCEIIRRSPVCLKPFRGINDERKKLFAGGGFQLYPTVKKTTLIYDPVMECFIKILHPLNIKNKIYFLFTDRAKAIYNISEYLFSREIKVQRVIAYGSFNYGLQPFFAVKKAEGESLYDIFIKDRRNISMSEYQRVIDEVAKLHRLDYWLGDAHLSHIFIKDGEVSGLIDIEGAKKNKPFRLKNPAKDIAGLNHPGLPLTKQEKNNLLNYYLQISGINNGARFRQLVKYYTERRWKE
jgi:hypothetical protein